MSSSSSSSPATSSGRKSSEEGSSIAGASLNLLNSIVGGGIVAIPHAIQQCGLCLGLFLLMFLAYGIYRIITVLMECGIKVGKLNLEELSGHYFGSVGFDIAAVIMILYAFGSMVACLVIIGDTLPPSIDDMFGHVHSKTRDEIVVIVGVVLVLPLSLFRHMSDLAFASGVAFFAVVMLVVGVLMVGPDESASQGLEFDVDRDFTVVNSQMFRGIGVLSFHYVCQHSCLLIFKSLETPSMRNVNTVSQISLGIVMFFSLMIGLGGYVYFGQSTDGNILNNFETKSEMIVIARMCMAINMIFTYPMECFVVRHAFFALLKKYVPVGQSSQDDGVLMGKWSNISVKSDRISFSDAYGNDKTLDDQDDSELWPPTILHGLATTCLWSISLCIAIVFEDVSVVLSLSGIVAASILGYVLPVAIYLKANEVEVRRKLDWIWLGNSVSSKCRPWDSDSVQHNSIYFFVMLGIFGVCSLIVGLIMEVVSACGLGQEISPTANY